MNTPLHGAPLTIREEDRERFWREGDRIVCEHGANLPDRCVACNAPTDGWYRRMSVVPDAASDEERMMSRLRALHLIVSPIGGPIGLLKRRLVHGAQFAMEITHGLCATHRRQWHIGIAVMACGVAACLALLVLAIARHSTSLAVGAFAAGLVLFVSGWLQARRPLPRVVNRRDLLQLRVSPEFLESIPPRSPPP